MIASFPRLLLLVIFIPSITFSQTASSGFKKLSCPEKRWVIFHPFIAKKAYRITLEARVMSKEMEYDTLLDHDPDGGQVDAFRHAYWMARLSQEICWRKARRLGIAHEKGNHLDFIHRLQGEEIFSDSIAGVMDLLNNDAGIRTGKKSEKLSTEDLRNVIRQKILNGEMKIIRKDKSGNSLDCDGNIIDMKKYSGVWNIPRCIIDSDKK